MIAHINIGSNIGDRWGYISRAVAAVLDLTDGRCAISAPFISEPWGYESQNTYVNIGMNVDTDLSPEVFFEKLRKIQHSIDPSSHRDENGAYIDRAIDIDIICIDNLVIATDMLEIPHPRMALRDFVLVPLSSLLPVWRHPVTGKTASEMLEKLKTDNKTIK